MSRQDIYNRTGWQYTETRYGAAHMRAYLAARNQVLQEHVRRLRGRPARILDVGCGTGLSLSAVSSEVEPPVRLFGTDFSHTMAVQTRAALGERPAHLSLADVRRLPYPDNTFDLVYSTRFIHQFVDKKPIFDELKRVTKPGGTLIVEFYGRFFHVLRHWWSPPQGPRAEFLSHFPSTDEVRRVVGQDYSTVALRLAGAKIVHSLTGGSALNGLTRLIGRSPLRPLVDEYFVIVQK